MARCPDAPWEGCFRFPLHDKDGHHLTELIVATPEGRPLTIYEEDFLERLALQAGVAVENARYYERSLEWARLQQDLHAARAIQRSLVPQEMPQIEGYSVAVRYSACYEVGGDCVDIVSLPDGVQVMAVADVAGKGLASAIVSTAFRSAFRASVAGGVALPELVSRLNRQHCAEGDEARNRYVTGIFLSLDPGGAPAGGRERRAQSWLSGPARRFRTSSRGQRHAGRHPALRGIPAPRCSISRPVPGSSFIPTGSPRSFAGMRSLAPSGCWLHFLGATRRNVLLSSIRCGRS